MKISLLTAFVLTLLVSAKSTRKRCSRKVSSSQRPIDYSTSTVDAATEDDSAGDGSDVPTTNSANSTMAGEGDSAGQTFAQCIKKGTNNDAFLRPFANVKTSDDVSSVSYCRTDKACACSFSGPDSVYTNPDSTCDLSCNSFCFYSKQQGKIILSTKFTGSSPPPKYFNCGAETCDNVKDC